MSLSHGYLIEIYIYLMLLSSVHKLFIFAYIVMVVSRDGIDKIYISFEKWHIIKYCVLYKVGTYFKV